MGAGTAATEGEAAVDGRRWRADGSVIDIIGRFFRGESTPSEAVRWQGIGVRTVQTIRWVPRYYASFTTSGFLTIIGYGLTWGGSYAAGPLTFVGLWISVAWAAEYTLEQLGKMAAVMDEIRVRGTKALLASRHGP